MGKPALVDVSNGSSDVGAYLVTAAVVVANTATTALQARCDLLQVDLVANTVLMTLASTPVTVPAGAPGSSFAHATLLGWIVVPAASSTTVTVACVNSGVLQFSATVTAVRVGALNIQ